MKTVTVSTCGTSILTNGTRDEDVKFLRNNANKRESEYNPEDIAKINNIVNEKSKLLVNSEPKDVRRLSAELNGFISFYSQDGRFESEEAGNYENIHYLIHTDTFQGTKTAEIIQAWGQAHNINMQLVQIDDLNTSSVEEFRIGANNLIEWCAQSLPGYREQGYRIIFNLVGGFKSLQGYMQTLGMFYADETIYIFERSQELLSIPKLPLSLDTLTNQVRGIIQEHIQVFRKLDVYNRTLPISECAGIPETLLTIIDVECVLSVWGRMIWNNLKKEFYREKLLEPIHDDIIISDDVRRTAEGLDGVYLERLNSQIDMLANFLNSGRKFNPNSLDYKKFKTQQGISTHEFDLWNEGHTRAFCRQSVRISFAAP